MLYSEKKFHYFGNTLFFTSCLLLSSCINYFRAYIAPPADNHINGNSVFCTDTTSCLGVGSYTTAIITPYPASAPFVSTGNLDSGIFISNPTTNFSIPSDATTGATQHVSLGSVLCDVNQRCILVGSYLSTYSSDNLPSVNIYTPLITSSTDNGVTFTSASSSSAYIPPSDANSAYILAGGLKGLACTSLTDCIGVGYYYQSSTLFATFPLVAHSTNFGATFTGMNLADAVTLPSDFNNSSNTLNAWFGGVSCFDPTNCIAVGSYPNPDIVPLVAYSTNAGQKFTAVAPGSVTVYAGATEASFTSVACTSTTHCIAVGYTYGAAYNYAPLVALSSDAGRTFTATAQSSFTLPSDALTDSAEQLVVLTGIACSDALNCLAVGYYANESTGSGMIGTGQFAPLSAITVDGGNSFVGFTAASSFTLPSDAATGSAESTTLGDPDLTPA